MKKLIVKIARAIVASVDKEEANKKAKEELEIKERQKARKLDQERERKISDIIWEHLEGISERMLKREYHIKAGDRVVVNKYNLTYSSWNGWDSGASALDLNSLGVEKKEPGALYGKIKSIRVAKGLTHEWIHNWYENLGYQSPGISDLQLEMQAVSLFRSWVFLNKTHMTDSGIWDLNNLGLYMEAHFELEGVDFDPKWGLNINSFVREDSEEGKATIEICDKEEEIARAYEIARNFEVEKKKILTKYGFLY